MGLKELYALPEKIKALREQMGMTQSVLAKRIGLTRASVNSWEMGVAVPSAAALVELSKIFHVSADYLLGLEQGNAVCVDGLLPKEVAVLVQLVEFLQKK